MRRKIWLCALAWVGVSACKKSDEAPAAQTEEKQVVNKDAPPKDAAEIAALKAKIAQFAPAELTTDVSTLTEPEKAAMKKIIEACALMDPIFDRQVMRNYPEVRAKLAEDPTWAAT